VVSTSDRRSSSSGPSKKRKSVFISTAPSERARGRDKAASAPSAARKAGGSAAKPSSEARRLAEARRNERDSRLAAQRRGLRLRIIGAVAAVALVIAGCSALYSSSLFTVKNVEVAGVVHITAARVKALAAVPSSATLIRFPADEVAARVAADPWVAAVTVSRVFPSGMRIRVTERVPAAIVDAGESVWLADASGVMISKPTTETTATLPLVRDVPGLDPKAGGRSTSGPLRNAPKVLASIGRELASQVRTVSAPTVDGATLLLENKVEVVVGEAVDLPKKTANALLILKEQKGKVVSIDVRVIDRPTWRGLK